MAELDLSKVKEIKDNHGQHGPATPYEVTADQTGPDVLTTEAAFLVYLDEHRHWIARSNIPDHVRVARDADTNDMLMAAAVITKDITVTEMAQTTVKLHHQAMNEMMRQVQAQQEMAQVMGQRRPF